MVSQKYFVKGNKIYLWQKLCQQTIRLNKMKFQKSERNVHLPEASHNMEFNGCKFDSMAKNHWSFLYNFTMYMYFFHIFFFQLTLFIACSCYIVLTTIYHSTSIKEWLRLRHYGSSVILKKSSLFDIPQIICDSIHKLFIESNISDFLSVALRLNLRHLLLLKNHEYTLLNSILKHCIEPLTEWIFHIKPSQAFFII